MATIKYWNGSAWELAIVGKQGPAGATGPTGPAGSASLQRFRFVATGGQTSVSGTDANGNTLAYTPGLEEVFLNGAALIRGQDYVATTGSSITSLTALIATDVVEILAWGVFDVANTISNTLIDAKGDILAGSAADTVSRLAVGANDTVLTADSSTATGLKWAAVASGPTDWTLLNAGGTALTGATTITVSSLSAKQMLILVDAASAGSGDQLSIRFNSDSNNNYTQFGLYINPQSTYSNTLVAGESSYSSLNRILLGNLGNNTASTCDGAIFVDLTDKTGNHFYDMVSGVTTGGGSDPRHYVTKGLYEGAAAITSVSIVSSGSNFDAGTIYIWGAN
jgi:hypothetical protein